MEMPLAGGEAGAAARIVAKAEIGVEARRGAGKVAVAAIGAEAVVGVAAATPRVRKVAEEAAITSGSQLHKCSVV